MISGSLSLLGRAAVISESFRAGLFIHPFSHIAPVIWTTRTYAVLGRNRIVLAFFAVIGLTCMILDIVTQLVTTGYPSIN